METQQAAVVRDRVTLRVILWTLGLCLLLALDPFNTLIENRFTFLKVVLLKNSVGLAGLFGTQSALAAVSHGTLSIGVASIEVGQVLTPLIELAGRAVSAMLFMGSVLGCMWMALVILKSYAFKALLVLAVLAMVPIRTRPIASRVLVLLMMLNPGLPIYLFICEGVAVTIDGKQLPKSAAGETETSPLGSSLDEALKLVTSDTDEIKKQLDEVRAADEERRKAEVKERRQIELANQTQNVELVQALEAGRAEKSVIEKVKDGFGKIWQGTKERLDGVFAETNEIFNRALERLAAVRQGVTDKFTTWKTKIPAWTDAAAQSLIAWFARSAILYVLMPLGYYVMLKSASRSLLSRLGSLWDSGPA